MNTNAVSKVWNTSIAKWVGSVIALKNIRN